MPRLNVPSPGVKRISLGPALYAPAMEALERATKALVAGDLASATAGITSKRINELLARGANQHNPCEPPLLIHSAPDEGRLT